MSKISTSSFFGCGAVLFYFLSRCSDSRLLCMLPFESDSFPLFANVLKIAPPRFLRRS